MSKTNSSFARPMAQLALALLTTCLSSTTFAQIFAGTGGGAIPDDNASGVTVTFPVTGLTQSVSNVQVVVHLQHTHLGDLNVELVSPNGLARLKLFGRVGARFNNAFGDSSDLSGQYSFSDGGTRDLWVTAAGLPAAGVLPGNVAFRTSVGGVPSRGLGGGCSSYLALAFGGLTPAQANGNWTLRVTDRSVTDFGTVSAANSALIFQTVATTETALFEDGFELGPRLPLGIVASDTVGSCTPAISSPSGSGVTDFVMTRYTPDVWRWQVKANHATGAVALPSVDFGDSDLDLPILGDFDGDGLSDFTVSRESASGVQFSVRRSSRPNDAPLTVNFAGARLESRMIADYDGDNVTDFAVYKRAIELDEAGEVWIKKSSTGATVRFLIPSARLSVVGVVGDINGDGRADFAGRDAFSLWELYSGEDGSLLSSFYFGHPKDSYYGGQITGTSPADITITRYQRNPQTNQRERMYQTRNSAGGAVGIELYRGIVGDTPVPGDYNGDGLIDYASYRGYAQPGQSRFVIFNAGAAPNTPPQEEFFGEGGDYPVGTWVVRGSPE